MPVAGSFNPANASYEWSGPNGFTYGPTSNPSIVISASGTYTSTVTVNGCRYVTTQQVDGITCTIQKGISPNGDGDNEAFILSDVKSLSIGMGLKFTAMEKITRINGADNLKAEANFLTEHIIM